MTKCHLLMVNAAVLLLFGAAMAYAQKPAATLARSDERFMKDAAEGGMDEVKLGEMAQQNASSDHVKSFARRMVTDHAKLNHELRTLANHKSVTLPSDISITQQASNKLLSTKNGESFDKSYMAAMIRDHKNDIHAFQKEASSGTDPDARAYASKALPMLREHLRMAGKVEHEVDTGK